MAQNSSRRSRADRVDRIDLNILSLLSRHARVSKVEMSAEVGISAGRCHERMRRLERSGIIRGYRADIDWSQLASSLQFLVQIKLLNDTAARIRQFEKAVQKIPEIIACHGVLGHIDYLIMVVAANIGKYAGVIDQLRAQSGGEFDFVTFPISKPVKAVGDGDLRQIVARLMADAG